MTINITCPVAMLDLTEGRQGTTCSKSVRVWEKSDSANRRQCNLFASFPKAKVLL
jgi:hypothetical protein